MIYVCYILRGWGGEWGQLVPRPEAMFRGCRIMLDLRQVNYVIRAKQGRWFVR